MLAVEFMTSVGLVALALLLMPLFCLAFVGQICTQIGRLTLSALVYCFNPIRGLITRLYKKKEQATEIDAIQALVRALSAQQKKVAKLQAEIKTDAHTKNDLRKQIKVLKEEKRSLSSILASSENSNDELKSKLVTLQTEYKMKIDQIARLKDMLILNENAESSHVVFTDQVSDSDEDVPQCEPSKQQATIYNLSSELKKAKEENEALRAELKAVTAAHERSEKLAESKIAILVEMKNALETQVQLLEAK